MQVRRTGSTLRITIFMGSPSGTGLRNDEPVMVPDVYGETAQPPHGMQVSRTASILRITIFNALTSSTLRGDGSAAVDPVRPAQVALRRVATPRYV